MSKDVWVGKKDYKYWYYRYKDSEYVSIGLIGLAIVTSIALIILIIIPQFENWFSIRNEVVATRARIAVLRGNINFINSLDKGTLNEQFQTASSALPPEKDFSSMLDVLSSAAINTGVSLNDFSFQVGNVSSSSATPVGIIIDPKSKGLSLISITVVVAGEVETVKRFIGSIEQSLPVSKIAKIDGTGQTISVTVDFYQKNYPNIILHDDTPIKPLSADKFTLLQKLASWKKVVPGVQSTGSLSAMPLF